MMTTKLRGQQQSQEDKDKVKRTRTKLRAISASTMVQWMTAAALIDATVWYGMVGNDSTMACTTAAHDDYNADNKYKIMMMTYKQCNNKLYECSLMRWGNSDIQQSKEQIQQQ